MHPQEKAKLREKYIAESVHYDQKQCMEEMENMFLREIENGKA